MNRTKLLINLIGSFLTIEIVLTVFVGLNHALDVEDHPTWWQPQWNAILSLMGTLAITYGWVTIMRYSQTPQHQTANAIKASIMKHRKKLRGVW